MLKKTKEKTLHDIFLIGIIINFVEGIIELAGGIIVALTKSGFIAHLVQRIFQHELISDPKDIVANYLVNASQHIPPSIVIFIAAYFIIHGLIKIGLFLGLWYKKAWAYPMAYIILSLLVAYQLIRFFKAQSIILLFTTIVDIVVIILLRSEHKRDKRSRRVRTG